MVGKHPLSTTIHSQLQEYAEQWLRTMTTLKSSPTVKTLFIDILPANQKIMACMIYKLSPFLFYGLTLESRRRRSQKFIASDLWLTILPFHC